jgi:hypothetical protein
MRIIKRMNINYKNKTMKSIITFIKKDKDNWKWLLGFYAIATVLTLLLTIQI